MIAGSIAAGLDVLGEKRALLAFCEMSLGARWFDQIARNSGTFHDILTSRLRTFENRGVIKRIRCFERPARYESHLITSRAEVSPIFISLAAWSSAWMSAATLCTS